MPSSPSTTGKPRRQLPLLGLFALFGGIGLVSLYRYKPSLSHADNPFAKVFYLGTGVILALWGIGAVIGELWPSLGGLRPGHGRRYRVKMPWQAVAYLVILVTLFVGAMVGRSNMLMLVFGLMAGPFVLNGSITFSMLKGTRVARQLPGRALVGEPFSVEIVLSNRKRWFSSWMMIVEDRLASQREALQVAVLFTRVPPHSERVGMYKVLPANRGRYAFGPLQVVSRFPLGLMERAVVVDATDALVVFPRIGILTPAWRRQAAMSNELIYRPQSRRGSFDDEFHHLREYRSGDNPRTIHWRTSARRNELMVREFHQNRDQNLFVLLDLWTPQKLAEADRERVELAVSFAATVCLEQCGQTGESTLLLGISGDEASLWEGPAKELSIDSVLERLALATAGPSQGLADLLTQVLPRCGSNTRSLLITTRKPGDETLAAITAAAEAASPLQVIEAAPLELASFFQFEGGSLT